MSRHQDEINGLVSALAIITSELNSQRSFAEYYKTECDKLNQELDDIKSLKTASPIIELVHLGEVQNGT